MLSYISGPHVNWKIITYEKDGTVHESEDNNLVVNSGRDLLLKCLFMLSGSAGVFCAGVGASSTAAVEADTRLAYEHIANGSRKTLLSLGGSSLSTLDIIPDVVTISGVTYYRKLVCKATWDSGDLNNGQTFAEYGLFTALACPGTPTGTSGVMFNHYIDASPALKSGANAIEAQITIRI